MVKKRYEQIAFLKHRIREAVMQYEFYESRVPKLERNVKQLKTYHANIEAVSIRELEKMIKIRADWYEVIEQRKQALRAYDKPKSKPKPKPKTVNGNGKIKCDICNEEFSKQGYPAHRKKCERIKELSELLEKDISEGEA